MSKEIGAMNGYELKLWRRGMGWCQEVAAEKLDVTRKTYARYEHLHTVPIMVVLATQALSLENMLTELEVSTKERIIAKLNLLLLQT